MIRVPGLTPALTIVAVAFAAIAATLPFDGALTASLAAALVLGVAAALRPHRGIAAFLVVALIADSAEHWVGTPLRFVDEIGVPLLAVTVIGIHRSRLRPFHLGVREAALAAVVVTGVVSSVANGVPAAVWVPALPLLLKAFAVFYLVLVLPLTNGELAGLRNAFLGIGAVIVAIGLAQFAAPDAVSAALNLPRVEQQRGGIQVVNSIFPHPALYGWLAAFLSLVFYARLVVTRSLWAMPVAVVFNLASVLSGRRTPVIGVVAALIVGIARQLSGGVASARTWLAVGVAGAVVLALSLPLLGDFYQSTLVEYGDQVEVMAEVFADDPDSLVLSTLQPRTGLYLGSVAIARDELPLGAGLGRFGSHMSREAYSPAYQQYGLERIWGLAPHVPIAVTDTFWPMVLGETGVIGLAGMALFLGLIGFELWRAAGRAAPSQIRTLCLAGLMVFTETAIRSLTSSVYLAPPIALFAFATFALALAGSRDLGGEPAHAGIVSDRAAVPAGEAHPGG